LTADGSAIDEAELIIKIALYVSDREAFVIKTLYSSGGPCVAVEVQHH
jgi:hypothetical protein